MKKYFLVFTLVILMLFASCAVNKEKTRTMTGILQGIIGSFKLSDNYSGIKGKLVIWKDSETPTGWDEEAIPSPIWPIYPSEIISEDMVGRKIKVTYQILETIQTVSGHEQVLLICIKKLEVLEKEGGK